MACNGDWCFGFELEETQRPEGWRDGLRTSGEAAGGRGRVAALGQTRLVPVGIVGACVGEGKPLIDSLMVMWVYQGMNTIEIGTITIDPVRDSLQRLLLEMGWPKPFCIY